MAAEILAAIDLPPSFQPLFHSDSLTEPEAQKSRTTTWKECCPVPLVDLRVLTVSHWGYDGLPARGKLITHSKVTEDLLCIFERLFAHGFLIQRMQPIEDFNGDDNVSMEFNNTSAFNCRSIVGSPNTFSKHSWGCAVDINPLYNPYVKGDTVLPKAGGAYLDRTRAWPGSILAGSFIVEIFKSRGWIWGGDWHSLKDYQHFEVGH